MRGQDALKFTLPFWEVHDYRLAVMCEAMSRVSGIPAIFYFDSVRACGMSLLHEKTHEVAAGFLSKVRPWYFGVGDPDTGKSHAVNGIAEACLRAEFPSDTYSPK